MVLGVKPVRLEVNVPVPVPLVVWLLLTSGFPIVFQQTPRAVTLKPPSSVILPPLFAVVAVVSLTAVVLIVGSPFVVVKLLSVP